MRTNPYQPPSEETPPPEVRGRLRDYLEWNWSYTFSTVVLGYFMGPGVADKLGLTVFWSTVICIPAALGVGVVVSWLIGCYQRWRGTGLGTDS